MPRRAAETIRGNIRGSLKEQLKKQKKTAEHWYDLVEDYLALWDVKQELIKEIRKNGAMVVWQNGSQSGRKKNDAVVELPKISKRMTDLLGILSAELIETDSEGGDDDV